VAARSLATVELQRQIGAVTGVLTLGQLQESNSVLGFGGAGALALEAEGRTTFMTLAGSLPLAPKTTLSAMATVGMTAGYENAAASLNKNPRPKGRGIQNKPSCGSECNC
jgi:hypothetical protein